MKITLDITKTVEENATAYFEKAKKSKKKIAGAEEAIRKFEGRYKTEEKKEQEKKEMGRKVLKTERKWFEKFRWSLTTDGYLIIAGRDATTNEILIKKHTEPDDVVFHASLSGSPFTVIKTHKKKASEPSIAEAAAFTATNSRAWRMGLGSLEVFHVAPSQVTKEAKAGEYMSKGSFMVYGKRQNVNASLECFIGVISKGKLADEDIGEFKGKIISGRMGQVSRYCDSQVHIIQGGMKPSDAAKIIKKRIGGDLDEIIRALPPGSCDVR
ncbi:DUF814 domain-containing protein [Candidatus Woesearchaeota archaeon]|nr:DUF814 domain-containing protein [Candidatus Woesearchaeota archaeon]